MQSQLRLKLSEVNKQLQTRMSDHQLKINGNEKVFIDEIK